MTEASSHAAYLAAAPKDLRPLLENARARLAHALPDAKEIVAYGIPGFAIGKTIVAGYAAFTKQCGLYVSPGAIASLADDIVEAGLKATRTGVKFSPGHPIPDALIEQLARASRKEHGL